MKPPASYVPATSSGRVQDLSYLRMEVDPEEFDPDHIAINVVNVMWVFEDGAPETLPGWLGRADAWEMTSRAERDQARDVSRGLLARITVKAWPWVLAEGAGHGCRMKWQLVTPEVVNGIALPEHPDSPVGCHVSAHIASGAVHLIVPKGTKTLWGRRLTRWQRDLS